MGIKRRGERSGGRGGRPNSFLPSKISKSNQTVRSDGDGVLTARQHRTRDARLPREREREEVVVASKDKWAALQGPWAADQRRSLFRLLRSFFVSLSILKISPHTGKSVHQVAQASSGDLPSRHVHRPPCYGSPNKRKGNHQHVRRRARH